MIRRIVKMTFKEEEIPSFLKLFEEVKNKIRRFEGCEFLELLQNKSDPKVIFTHSHWTSERALNNYRYSPLFEKTWKKTKACFADKPEAWSTEMISSTIQNNGE